MLRDWSWNKAGDVIEVFEPTAKDWIREGIAAPAGEESRSLRVEQATMSYEKRKQRT